MAGVRRSKTPITIDEIKGSELYGVLLQASGEAKGLDDGVILQKLASAEDFYERDLQMKFQTTRVLSDPRRRADSQDAALRVTDFNPVADISEPAYDLDPGLWREQRAAMIKLRHRPVNDVYRILFSWFDVGNAWSVPKNWIVWDDTAGTVQISPRTGQAAIMGFGNYLLTSLAAGRGVPHCIYIDYEVGFGDDQLCAHHNDLLEGVRLRTLLLLAGAIATIAIPGGQTGGSLSQDGLSESRSFGGKWGPYSGKIQLATEQEAEIRESWRRHEKGVEVAFA